MKKCLWAVALLLIACTDSRNKLEPASSAEPLPHAIQSARLRELMDRMDILLQEGFKTEFEVDSERRKYAKRIAGNAENLSTTAAAVARLLPSLKLDEKDQRAFLALADKLSDQANVLRKQAEQNHIDVMDNTMRQINETCASCHSLFRKPNR